MRLRAETYGFLPRVTRTEVLARRLPFCGEKLIFQVIDRHDSLSHRKVSSMKNISLLLTLLLLVTAGCIPKKKEVKPDPMADPHAGMKLPGMEQTEQMPSQGGLDYEAMLAKLPEGWKRVEPLSSMRVAQVAIAPAKGDTATAELVYFHFPGTGGSAAANIHRCQSQYTGPKG